MIVERRVVGPLQTNCYLLGDPAARQAVVIDPVGPGKDLSLGREDRRISWTWS